MVGYGGCFRFVTPRWEMSTLENLVLVGAPCDYHANGFAGK